MQLNAITLTLFAFLALPSVWALPLQDNQIVTRDHGIVRTNTNLAQRDISDRQGGKHKPPKVFYLKQCLGWSMLIILKPLKKDKKEESEEDAALKAARKKAEAEALRKKSMCVVV